MPIHKRDRSFQKIVDQVDIDNIPAEFIHSMSLILENGDSIVFEGADLAEIEEDNIFSFLMSAVHELSEDYGSPVTDLQVVIDYKELEKQVRTMTSKILNKDVDDDKGNTSV
tara:strand:+ start:716 stop:1051 length:336 start_codon:yes stop_codon:yes gene_type:complete